MPGGSGGSTPGSQTVTQTNLPDYAKPYFKDLMAKGQAVTNEPYQAYQGDRLAGFSDQTKQAYKGISGMVGQDYGMDSAFRTARQATNQYDPTTYSADMVGPNDQLGSNFGQNIGQFMNPYVENVLNVQKDQAYKDYNRLASDRNAQYVKAGAFGGSRSAVSDYLAEEGLSDRMARIDAEGYNSAFESAAGKALSSQQYNIETGLRSDLANQDASLRAQQYGDLSRQFGADLGIRGAGMMGDLAGKRYGMDLDQQKNLLAIGQDKQNLAQSQLDLQYEDFLNQRDYPRNSLQFMAGLLRGVPVSPNSNISTSQYQSPFSSLLGTGITGYALSQLLGGQK